VRIVVYNILGQSVRTLYSGLQAGGDHTVFWIATNDAGDPVHSGVYFYRLTTPSETISKKMMYIK